MRLELRASGLRPRASAEAPKCHHWSKTNRDVGRSSVSTRTRAWPRSHLHNLRVEPGRGNWTRPESCTKEASGSFWEFLERSDAKGWLRKALGNTVISHWASS